MADKVTETFIHRRRVELGLSQADLRRLTHGILSDSEIHTFDTGKRRPKTYQAVKALATALQCTEDEIVNDGRNSAGSA